MRDRKEFEGETRPLARETFAACVDSCGGRVLGMSLAQKQADRPTLSII